MSSLGIRAKLCNTSSSAKCSTSVLQKHGKQEESKICWVPFYCHICSDCKGMVCKQLPRAEARRTNIQSFVCSLCGVRHRNLFNCYSSGCILAPLCFPGTAATYVQNCSELQAWGFCFFVFLLFFYRNICPKSSTVICVLKYLSNESKAKANLALLSILLLSTPFSSTAVPTYIWLWFGIN